MKEGSYYLIDNLLSSLKKPVVLTKLFVSENIYLILDEKNDVLIGNQKALVIENKYFKDVSFLTKEEFEEVKKKINYIIHKAHCYRESTLMKEIILNEDNHSIAIPSIYSLRFGEKLSVSNLICPEILPKVDFVPPLSNVTSNQKESESDSEQEAIRDEEPITSDDDLKMNYQKAFESESDEEGLTEKDLRKWLVYNP